ncbi:hypothetical protein [Neobacillus drentensis]|uniref:hypothetical protein n=1 Tax=Neobacillus drentensis TaxID=220684 RepID=UPI00300259D0
MLWVSLLATLDKSVRGMERGRVRCPYKKVINALQQLRAEQGTVKSQNVFNIFIKETIILVIKSLSEKTTGLAKRTRDFLEETGIEPVFLAPFGVRKINIFEDEETSLFTVCTKDENKKELDVVEGIYNLKYCWIYAKAIAEAAGLSVEDIEYTQKIVKNENG